MDSSTDLHGVLVSALHGFLARRVIVAAASVQSLTTAGINVVCIARQEDERWRCEWTRPAAAAANVDKWLG